MDIEQIDRLTMLGVPIGVAIQIIEGQLNEGVQLERFRVRQLAIEWSETANNRNICPCPLWDVDPENFYLAGDGWRADEFDQAGYSILYADTCEILENLHQRKWIESDPWSEHYKSKTAVIAYRWCNGLSVTPPLLSVYNKKLLVGGGNHRLRYAHFSNAHRIPFLIARDQILQAEAILRSASGVN